MGTKLADVATVVGEPEIDRAVATLVLAFSSDPLARWMYPDPHHYLLHVPRQFRILGTSSFKTGAAQRIGDGRNRIAEQHDFRALGRFGQNRRLDIHDRTEAERGAMMLIENQPVEAKFLGINFFVQVFVKERRSVARVEVFIRQAEEAAMAQDLGFQRPASLRLSFGVVVILPLSKPHQMHDGLLPRYWRKFFTSLTKLSDASTSGRCPQASNITTREFFIERWYTPAVDIGTT